MRIAKVLEQFNMLWLEVDMYDPEAILQIKQSTSTRICTGENLFYMREFIPYFELRAADVFMIDIPWNGFSQSKKVGDLELFFGERQSLKVEFGDEFFYIRLGNRDCSFQSEGLKRQLSEVLQPAGVKKSWKK